ncbi:hypothetical protein HWV62_40020 [Athelia sp. TMB]|nr:hypothetical protein HWV62_40020 [Athelia sp. TMB]
MIAMGKKCGLHSVDERRWCVSGATDVSDRLCDIEEDNELQPQGFSNHRIEILETIKLLIFQVPIVVSRCKYFIAETILHIWMLRQQMKHAVALSGSVDNIQAPGGFANIRLRYLAEDLRIACAVALRGLTRRRTAVGAKGFASGKWLGYRASDVNNNRHVQRGLIDKHIHEVFDGKAVWMCGSIVQVVKAVLTKAALADQLEGCAAKPLQHIDLLRACFDSGQNTVTELGNIRVKWAILVP